MWSIGSLPAEADKSRVLGIGQAEYVAMRALGEPDAFPTGDVALQSALEISGARAAEMRAEPWRPWRSYATMYLWMMGHKSKGSKKGAATS